MSKANKSPAFQLYTRDLLSDGHVIAMELDEFGLYMKLLVVCWNEKGLPIEPERLTRIAKTTRDNFDRLWPAVAPCFYEKDGHLQQKRLDKERRKQAKYRRAMQLNGRKGGRPVKAAALPRVLKKKADKSIAFAFASSTADQDLERDRARARGGKLAYDGRFLTVFRWQFTELGKRLANAGREDFELARWFERVEADLERTGEALPVESQERWIWLQYRLMQDADLPVPSLGNKQRTGKTAGNLAALQRFASRGQS